jgi:8-amino-7-oxononanoate synthase
MNPPDLDAQLRAELEQLAVAGLLRTRRMVTGAPGPELTVDGQRLLAFCSNDYLGLAADSRVREAAISAIQRVGVGAGAAHLVSGHTSEHHALEEELAAFTGREAALLFSTGYMANLGAVTALAGRGDLVLEDRLNHASLIDAGLLAQARFQRYAHAEASACARALGDSAAARKLVVTDGVFSMDGDVAPLAALAAIAREHHAVLIVDDAHGLGVVGATGRGALEQAGLSARDVPVLVGTLGKAFGTAGAFVAGSRALIDTLLQRARTYVYTTALPPALAAATRAALRIADSEPERRQRLATLVTRFRAEAARIGLVLLPSDTPIQPLLVGDANRALAWSEALRERGLWVPAIRPPTVPVGSARLRITFSAAHSDAELERLLEALAATAPRFADAPRP